MEIYCERVRDLLNPCSANKENVELNRIQCYIVGIKGNSQY